MIDKLKADFLKDLHKLDKSGLVNFIYTYFEQSIDIADGQCNDEKNYMMAEFGRIKMCALNRLRFLLIQEIEKAK